MSRSTRRCRCRLPPVAARVTYAIEGQEGVIRAVARTPVHDTHGDAWSMPLAVVPRLSVQAGPTTQIIPAGANPSAELSVVVRATSDHATATVQSAVAKRLEDRTEIV